MADESRVYVIPSAPGKRFSDDTKVIEVMVQPGDEVKRGAVVAKMTE